MFDGAVIWFSSISKASCRCSLDIFSCFLSFSLSRMPLTPVIGACQITALTKRIAFFTFTISVEENLKPNLHLQKPTKDLQFLIVSISRTNV